MSARKQQLVEQADEKSPGKHLQSKQDSSTHSFHVAKLPGSTSRFCSNKNAGQLVCMRIFVCSVSVCVTGSPGMLTDIWRGWALDALKVDRLPSLSNGSVREQQKTLWNPGSATWSAKQVGEKNPKPESFKP